MVPPLTVRESVVQEGVRRFGFEASVGVVPTLSGNVFKLLEKNDVIGLCQQLFSNLHK